jgi:type II secretory pathway component PulF
MKRFYYRVLTSDSRQHEGYLLAENRKEMSQQVLNTFPPKTFVLEIRADHAYRQWLRQLTAPKIDLIRKLHFTRQLQSLLSSGVTVLDALQIIGDMSRDKEMTTVIKKLIHHIGTGLSFSQACQHFPELYTEEELSLIRAGEISGVLADILLDLYHIIEWDKTLLEKVKKAIRYPSIVIGITFVSMMGVFTFIIPKFAGFFLSSQIEIPLLTRVLLSMSGVFLNHGLAMVLGILVLGALLFFGYKKPSVRAQLDTYVFYIPVVGLLYKHLLISRFSRIFSILYTHGISILEALQILRQLSVNTVYQRDIAFGIASVRQGISLSDAISKSIIFSGTPSQMIATGEKGGTLGSLMRQASDFYSEDITFVTDRLFTYLEPFTIVLIGIMVLALSLGVFMPMLGMVTSVGK